MKAREFYKKLENYNEVAQILNEQRATLRFEDEFMGRSFFDFNSFKKWINETYIEEIAKSILKSDDFEDEKTVVIPYCSHDGSTTKFEVRLSLCRL